MHKQGATRYTNKEQREQAHFYLIKSNL
jgi:hypothetical protein